MHKPTPISIESAPPVERRRVIPFTHEEKRRIFRGMVAGELEAGILRYSRRMQLLRYAERLGIDEFEATLLIAEAQYHADQIEPIRFDSEASVENFSRPEAWSIPVRLAVAVMAALFINLLLIWWLVG